MGIQEISGEENMEKPFSSVFAPKKKRYFVVIGDQITPILLHVWNKDTIQVSDNFRSIKCVV